MPACAGAVAHAGILPAVGRRERTLLSDKAHGPVFRLFIPRMEKVLGSLHRSLLVCSCATARLARRGKGWPARSRQDGSS
jgi:hypothetical protein